MTQKILSFHIRHHSIAWGYARLFISLQQEFMDS